MGKIKEEILVGNVLYGQSGGPTSVINSSAYGLFKEAFKHKDRINKVYAMHFGLEGLLKDDLIEIKENSRYMEKLKNTPGAFLVVIDLKSIMNLILALLKKYIKFLKNIILDIFSITVEMTQWILYTKLKNF